ncbi:MAG: cyclic nucleotide-binding domain-containing protein [Chloroflexi bacterium]|nr:cyclic nucleotide-binding domain-containing protein [Chloroflexota bacterium]
MQTFAEILKETRFFKDLNPEYIELLAGCGSNARFDPGDYIFKEGGDADTFYLIRHGQVALEVHDPRRGQIVVDTLHEDDILGWSWLFPPYKWHYSARAMSLTRGVAMDGKCLRGKCDMDTALGYELMKRFAVIMVDRLQATRLQVLNIYG